VKISKKIFLIKNFKIKIEEKWKNENLILKIKILTF